MKFSFLFVIVLLVLAVVPLVALKRGPFARRPAAGDLRHPVVRILCAIMLLAILGATSWFTWIDQTQRYYQPANIVVPTKPAPPLSGTEPFGLIDPGPCKVILTVCLLDEPTLQPVWASSVVSDWPVCRDQPIRLSGDSFQIDFDAEFRISGFRAYQNREDVQVQGSFSIRGSNWSRSGGWSESIGKLHHEGIWAGSPSARHPMSLVPRHNGNHVIVYHIARAAADDPLGSVAADEWLAGFPTGQKTSADGHGRSGVRFSSDTSPGVKMLAYTGPASFLLLLAAAFGAQSFRRRGIAFTALLAGMVLYAGTLDYAIMRRHAARAADESLTLTQRHSAAIQAGQTFFHQPAARKLLDTAKQLPAEAER
ncbi:MAG: hypothetical protein J0M04_15170 [Verrucomicrobia bacterium]|nr:hypothetical protein [Verrucomicrobiota bacterium]